MTGPPFRCNFAKPCGRAYTWTMAPNAKVAVVVLEDQAQLAPAIPGVGFQMVE